MRIDILTLFPPMFKEPLKTSILGRAHEAGVLETHVHDIRDWADNKHNKVDDRPFGGGPGMVMMCQPLYDAVLAVEKLDPRRAQRVLLTPQGRRTTQTTVETLATQERLLLIAGHYEGIDERVIETLAPLELSIGDYVLSGGELPALVLVDAITRLLPGALGHEESASEDSFSVTDETGKPLLDTPHFTRPREWDGKEVPEILLSGDHGAVARWRHEQRLARTIERRPDLREPPSGKDG
ncbi:MAG: tRNA (guanosine(37)-N1)-methyltransferase TrmD [Planctomycetes bacterium]|nr:tRNA (guanosine(37)-N1)-methyltransferase TrmD [Planctomycetota bacterium]MCP4838947.1 tRNA (guanosine(37)-N1)-methyltransferase TrmD [Planctomycetota bacterium]